MSAFRSVLEFVSDLFAEDESGLDARKRAVRTFDESPNADLVATVDAWYRPHGGGEKITVVCRPDGGRVERWRRPYQEEPRTHERELDDRATRDFRRALRRIGAMELTNQREPIRDGLRCTFAFAEADGVRTVELLGFSDTDVPHVELLNVFKDMSTPD